MTDPITPASPEAPVPALPATKPAAPAEASKPAQPAQAPRPAAPKQSSGGGSALFSLVLFAVAAGGIYYTWTNPNPLLAHDLAVTRNEARQAADQAATLTQEAASLPGQLQALSDRLDKLERAPAPAPVAAAPPPDLTDLTKRVDDLAAKVEALASRPAEANGQPAVPQADLDAAKQGLDAARQAIEANKTALADLSQRVADAFRAQKGAVDQLGARVGKLEENAGSASQIHDETTKVEHVARVQSAIVALAQGRPLGKIDGAAPALARFATVAPPTEAALRETYPALARQARRLSVPDLSGKSFWQRALTRMQESVTVREGGDVLVGDPAAGILADAGHRLDTGDLAGAVAILGRLTGPAAAVMQPWVDDASALVAARAALASLAAHS